MAYRGLTMKKTGSLIWKGIDRLARFAIRLVGKISPALESKCLKLWNNEELIRYLFAGAATTAVNYFVYWFATRILHFGTLPGTWAAWFCAVCFGYWVNKAFVFHTHCETIRALFSEAVSFFSMRLASLGIETVLMWLTVTVLHLPDLLMKLLINIVVIILNYFFSKLFIFRKKK